MVMCTYCVPSFDTDLRRDKSETLQCMRSYHQGGDHIVKLVDGRYAAWKPERCPDCEDPYCDQDGEDCFVWQIILEEEALKLAAKS